MQYWGNGFQQAPSYPEVAGPFKEFVSFVFTHHFLVQGLMGFRHVKATRAELGQQQSLC